MPLISRSTQRKARRQCAVQRRTVRRPVRRHRLQCRRATRRAPYEAGKARVLAAVVLYVRGTAVATKNGRQRGDGNKCGEPDPTAGIRPRRECRRVRPPTAAHGSETSLLERAGMRASFRALSRRRARPRRPASQRLRTRRSPRSPRDLPAASRRSRRRENDRERALRTELAPGSGHGRRRS